jgi:hypothetical protein
MERLEVRADHDRWSWAYRNGNGVELQSNQLYERRAEAEFAARSAYPDVSLEPIDGDGDHHDADRRMLIAVVVLLLTVIGLGIVLWRQPDQDEG